MRGKSFITLLQIEDTVYVDDTKTSGANLEDIYQDDQEQEQEVEESPRSAGHSKLFSLTLTHGLYYKHISIVNNVSWIIRVLTVSDATTWSITNDHN